MIKSLVLYIKERFNLALYIGLAVYLYFFAFPEFPLLMDWIHLFYSFSFLFLGLFSFRIFDDLFHIPYDKKKPKRSYVNQTHRKHLTYILPFIFILLLLLLYPYSPYSALYLGIFVILNLVLYLMFISNQFIRPFLPLLKYPAFILILTIPFADSALNTSLLCLLIFLILVVFETMEDENFIIPYNISKYLQIVCFSILYFLNPELVSLALCGIFLLISFVLTNFKVNYSPYFIILFFLINHLIINNI